MEIKYCTSQNNEIMSANILLITPATIKDRTSISKNISDNQITPLIKVAQDIFIQPATGSGLFLRLQEGVAQNNLNTYEQDLIDRFITDALVWYTVSLMVPVLSFQLFSKGTLQPTSDGAQTVSRADLELVENKYKAMAEFYNTRLIKHLKENYVNFYQYLNPGSGVDVIFPQNKAYTCPIYIGGADSTISRDRALNGNVGTPQPYTVEFTPAAGLASFVVGALAGKVLLTASRSGLLKGITQSPTTDTAYLQINGSTVTLPTGDVTMENELFTFLVR
jgi:hypothetical protein